MRAYVVTAYKRALELRDVPEPEVGPQDVLVAVRAAGLNHLDDMVRKGTFKLFLPYKPPFTLGHDVAGTVVRVGSAVRSVAVGDEVWSRVPDGRIGTFAERVAIAAEDLSARPRSISMEAAGSLPLVALTAWQALVERGSLAAGQKVLIHAGAGGVGTVAIQLAKHLGAHVATTVSARNADLVRELGADTVVDYRSQDFSTVLDGYDLVLDSQGGTNLERSLRVLRPGGKAIGIAGPPDPAFARQRDLNPLVRTVIGVLSAKVRRQAKQLEVSYEFLFMRADGAQLATLADLVDRGVIAPVLERTAAFDDLPQALDALGAGGGRGKTVVTLPA